MAVKLPRLRLAHLPTPLVHDERLSDMLDVELWIKRDDATGGAEAGNKIRKLEFLLADALERGATDIITCGGIQSNHARATAVLAARLGLGCTLLLRVTDGSASGYEHDAKAATLPPTGNVFLDRLVGARIRTITPEDYARRTACMMHVSSELTKAGKRPYVIPEGGSNALGAFGYVEAMRELREQIDLGLAGTREPFGWIVHACGSGGTAAGIAIGCGLHAAAERVRAFAVCDDAAYFERATSAIIDEARGMASIPRTAPLTVDDREKGPRYGEMNASQRAMLVRVARTSGVVLDPVYTGKAMCGLAAAILRGDIARGARVVFVHTGGLPALLADATIWGEA